MVGWGMAAAAAGSAALGAIGDHKALTSMRTNRTRIGQTLKAGRTMYGLQADAALSAYLDAIGRSEQGTSMALAETERLGATGSADIQASLAQQLARNRVGAGSVLAQSSLMPAFNRGAYSDARRDLGALSESIAARRASIHMGGAAAAVNAQQALANALFRRGETEFQMQQALAGRFQSGGAPGSFDLGGLGVGLDDLFKSLFPSGGGGPQFGAGDTSATVGGGGYA